MRIITEYNKFVNRYITTFKDLQKDDYIILYESNQFVGYFKVLDKYASASNNGEDSMNVQKYNEDGTFNPAYGNFVIYRENTNYTYEKLEKVYTSGIVFFYNEKILLVHPTNHTENQYSYPKGQLNPGETPKDGAIREVREEIGIEIDANLVKEENLRFIKLLREKNFKTYYYYIVYLSSQEFKKYFNVLTIPKANLQLDEIDWAGFVDVSECGEKLDNKFQTILNNFH